MHFKAYTCPTCPLLFFLRADKPKPKTPILCPACALPARRAPTADVVTVVERPPPRTGGS